jgi:hypothetical protein
MHKKAKNGKTLNFYVLDYRFSQKKSSKSDHRGGAEFGTHGFKKNKFLYFEKTQMPLGPLLFC